MATTLVPELLAKKRKRDETWATEKAAAAVDARKKARATRKDIFKRAEKYVADYRAQVRGAWTVARKSAALLRRARAWRLSLLEQQASAPGGRRTAAGAPVVAAGWLAAGMLGGGHQQLLLA